ncbi:MAG: hypothetical protein IJ743_04465 [Bacilli bacterium]|nr:hypothetical protein [Bacilli bacterium]
MKSLKCKSCGGEMVIDSAKEFATCPYCKSKVKLKETHDINIKLDDSIKEFMKPPKWIFIPIIIIFTIVLLVFFTVFKSMSETHNDMGKTTFSINQSMHNMNFEPYSGTQAKIFIENLLDNAVTNNKTNQDLIVSVQYADKETSNPNEIIEIKHSLENKKYEIKLDYNDDGYVNKITIENL